MRSARNNKIKVPFLFSFDVFHFAASFRRHAARGEVDNKWIRAAFDIFHNTKERNVDRRVQVSFENGGFLLGWLIRLMVLCSKYFLLDFSLGWELRWIQSIGQATVQFPISTYPIAKKMIGIGDILSAIFYHFSCYVVCTCPQPIHKVLL